MTNFTQVSCEYGLKPYIDNTINALNPCFMALVSNYISLLFIIIGIIQLFQLCFKAKVPNSFNKNIVHFNKIPTNHITHLTSLLFQSSLLGCELIIATNSSDYPTVIVNSIISNLFFTTFVAIPTQYIQYFKSICSIGNQLFYFLLQVFIIGFQLSQRYFHRPVEKYNIIKGQYGLILEVLLLVNSTSIFVYDLCFFTPSTEILSYYKSNNMFESVNVFADLTFMWMNKLITETYYNNKLKDPNNLPLPPIDLDIKSVTKMVKGNWEIQKWKKTNSLFRAIWKTFGNTILYAIFLETIKDLLTIIEPQLLRLFIICFQLDEETSFPALHGVFIAFSLFLINITSTILKNKFFITIFEAGLGIRGSVASLVYEKSMMLSSASSAEYATGDILNLLSVDVLRLQRFFENSQSIIGAPIEIITVLISLYFLLGKAIIGGLVSMAIMIPINTYLSKKVKSLTKTQMKFKDRRIKTVTEMLSSMKSIKLYAWERPMLERLDHVRNDLELNNLKKIGIATNLIYFAWNCVPLMVTCSSFLIFAYISNTPLTPEIVFPSLSLFNLLNYAIFEIPSTINTIIETNVSMDRLKKFLLAEELDSSFIERTETPTDGITPAVEIENATFLWKSKDKLTNVDGVDEEENIGSTEIALKCIDHFQANAGDLTCIVGRVGSGKSTILKAIIGQLPCISGSLETVPPKLSIRGETIAYCPQEPWIMNQSIKENILFGRKFDQTSYENTIKACQLLTDFKIFPDGDETIVGEKGISLSGGQKSRLSLARAVYSDADIYLLDDILSAVDAGVRKHIIYQVLDRDVGLLKNRTVILTTNTLAVLKHAQKIYILQNSSIIEEGTYEDAVRKEGSESTLRRLLREFDSNNGIESDTNKSDEESRLRDDDKKFKEMIKDGIEDEVEDEIIEFESSQLRRPSFATLKSIPLVEDTNLKGKTTQENERMAIGRVKFSVYMTYAKACGLGGVSLFFVFLLLSRILNLAERFWLKYWSESNEKSGANLNVIKFVSVYAAIAIASAAFSNLRTIILLIYCSIRGSKNLHNGMARSIMRSPMQFFETTPVGRIINRFSSDIDAIDTSIQQIFAVFANSVLDYFVTILLIGFNMPWFFVFNAFILVIYVYYQKFYMVQSRDLKRLTSVSYSPIMSLMSESLGGRTVIAAYNQVNMFLFFNQQRIQNNIDCVFTYRSTNRWLSIRLQSIGAVIILLTALLTLYTVNTTSQLGTGMVGLLMSYVMNITISLTWIVRSSVLLETSVVSVERVVEYCNLPPEAEEIIQDKRPEEDWPSQGLIEFKNYSTSYRSDLDPVLNGINIEIKPTEKVGIVGRTGAGKSTLTLALYRLLEATEGSIIIDGVDISEIGLFDLRSNLAIIPQDAQAFEGTVRYNLDPFNRYSNEELWKAIEQSHLKTHLIRLVQGEDEIGNDIVPNCLEFKVSENGSNLSLGQRQLLCLARALLNKSKILVLDEATAAVDVETDKIIQETIRSQFKNRTILTIAHRIDTVMDSDKILVLDKGEVVEFDTPDALLAQKDSFFYKLCEQGNYIKSNNTNA